MTQKKGCEAWKVSDGGGPEKLNTRVTGKDQVKVSHRQFPKTQNVNTPKLIYNKSVLGKIKKYTFIGK